MKDIKCYKCGRKIDKGACGQWHSIITIKDDRDNLQEKYHQDRFYLCEICTYDLKIFLNKRREKW